MSAHRGLAKIEIKIYFRTTEQLPFCQLHMSSSFINTHTNIYISHIYLYLCLYYMYIHIYSFQDLSKVKNIVKITQKCAINVVVVKRINMPIIRFYQKQVRPISQQSKWIFERCLMNQSLSCTVVSLESLGRRRTNYLNILMLALDMLERKTPLK